MTNDQKHKIVRKLEQQLSQAFSRMEELEKEEMYGLEHTALREQIYRTLELVDILKETFPFFACNFNELNRMVDEKRARFSWFGYI
jgi:hypothetical protein